MGLAQITYLLFLLAMNYTIDYYSDDVQQAVMALPKSLQVRYVSLTGRMMEHGPNLGEPHTKPFGAGLFELRLKGAEGVLLHHGQSPDCHAALLYQENRQNAASRSADCRSTVEGGQE